MDLFYGFYRLELDNNQIVYQYVQTVFSNFDLIIKNGDFKLLFDVKSTFEQFMH